MNLLNIVKDLFHQPLFVCFVAIVTCACYYYLKNKQASKENLVWIIYASLFAFAVVTFLGAAVIPIYEPRVWDFGPFYLYGNVAARGYNFYLPENFHQVFHTLNTPFTGNEGFTEEVLNIGFPYPPPTMFYFLPLGFMPFKTALIFWTIVNLFFVWQCISLAYKMFFKSDKINGVFLTTILFCVFLPSISTIISAQTNFILLYFLLLMRKYADHKLGGIFLTLAFFTKPYMIIFLPIFLLGKNWKAIGYFVLSSVLLVAITAAVFGTAPFMSYIFDSPFDRLPKNLLFEDTKQALIAVLLRMKWITTEKVYVFTYISIAGLVLTAGYVYFLVRKKLYDHIWATLILAALILYPNTQNTYGVLLLFIIYQFFDKKNQLGSNVYVSILLVGAFFYLSTFWVFGSMCLLLAIVVVKSLRAITPIGIIPDRPVKELSVK